jgi:hypothetical protein
MTTNNSSIQVYKEVNENEIDDDYRLSREVYRDMIDKNKEAIDLVMDLARESEHPRVFEVLSNMLKQNSEIADHLMDLHKRRKEILTPNPQAKIPQSNITQNNLFVGSTTDLQKIIHNKINGELNE